MRELVEKVTIVPVVVIDGACDAVPLARAGGLPVIEVTMRTAAARDAVAAIRSAWPANWGDSSCQRF